MIVVWARRQHDVRIPLANLPDYLLAHLQRRQQLPVVIVQDFIFDAETPRRFPGLAQPPLSQGSSMQRLVPHVSVGDGHELHRMAGCGE